MSGKEKRGLAPFTVSKPQRQMVVRFLLACAEDWLSSGQTFAGWIEHAKTRHGGMKPTPQPGRRMNKRRKA